MSMPYKAASAVTVVFFILLFALVPWDLSSQIYVSVNLPEIEAVMGYGMLSSNSKKGGLKNPDTMHFIFKAKDNRVARVSGAYTGPVQPVMRNRE